MLCAIVSGAPKGLNSKNAEEILAQFAEEAPMLEKDWLDVVGERKDEKHTVGSGDSLWDISGSALDSPWYWGKLWEVNPYLSNPHELELGDIVRFYRKGLLPSELPVVKLIPGIEGAVTDLDNDTFVDIHLKNRFQPSYFVMSPDDPIFGVIKGSYSPKEYFSYQDPIFVELYDSSAFSIGDKFAVIRMEHELSGFAGIKGTVAKLVGEIELDGEGERLFRADPTGVYDFMKRGDFLVSIQKVTELHTVSYPPDDLRLKVIAGESVHHHIFGQGHLVMLDKGTVQGVIVGQRFRTLTDTDPVTFKQDTVIPDYVSDIQIVFTSKHSSIGYLLSSRDVVHRGDILLPRQFFPDPPAPPRQPVVILTFD